MRAIIGADHYTTSLREAVEACVQVAREAADSGRPHLTVVTDANQPG